jgi:hypothetical protein
MVNEEESYSVEKAMWRRTVKDMPQCFACCCGAGLMLMLVIALPIIYTINTNKKPLTYTHIDVENNDLVVINSLHVLAPFVDNFAIERIGKILLVSNIDSDEIHTLQDITEEELEDQLKKHHAIFLRTTLVDRDGIGRFSLADLKINTDTKYSIVGIGGYYTLGGDSLSRYMKLYYQFDVTDLITDYKLRHEKKESRMKSDQ